LGRQEADSVSLCGLTGIAGSFEPESYNQWSSPLGRFISFHLCKEVFCRWNSVGVPPEKKPQASVESLLSYSPLTTQVQHAILLVLAHFVCQDLGGMHPATMQKRKQDMGCDRCTTSVRTEVSEHSIERCECKCQASPKDMLPYLASAAKGQIQLSSNRRYVMTGSVKGHSVTSYVVTRACRGPVTLQLDLWRLL
jgi:hypothetical protein